MPYQLDHRQLADEMQIFFFDQQIGPGLPVWLPNGVAIREALERLIGGLEQEAGYVRVVSPHIAKAELYHQSGHMRAFEHGMYPPMKGDSESEAYLLKPMNCPHHHKIFASQLRSYRALPLRIAEYGQVYRFENSGSLRGLSRVRGLCQNDAHIYVQPELALDEICQVLKMHELCYRRLGLKGYHYRLSKHDPKQMNLFDGDIENWLHCESILRQALEILELSFVEAVGEAAFYGPKIDVQMRIGIDGDGQGGKEESIASVQLDFNSAERFSLKYVGSDGKPKSPLIIHRAPLGSHERFIALLLEYFDGQLPWNLVPIQVHILPVDERFHLQAQDLVKKLCANGVRAQVDISAGILSKRLRVSHQLRPYFRAVIGEREIKDRRIHLHGRGEQHELPQASLVGFFDQRQNL